MFMGRCLTARAVNRAGVNEAFEISHSQTGMIRNEYSRWLMAANRIVTDDAWSGVELISIDSTRPR